jgi:hypothetical protein
MLIPFDHGTPAPLRSFLKDHTVKKTKDLGWDTLSEVKSRVTKSIALLQDTAIIQMPS